MIHGRPSEGVTAPLADLERLVQAHGGPLSSALLDPMCRSFAIPSVDGAIGYRRAWDCAVALGDPVCPAADAERLARAFQLRCHLEGCSTVYAGASARFAEVTARLGYAQLS